MPDCSARGPGIESRCGQMFIVKTTVIYSLGHGMCTFPVVPIGQLSLLPSVER